ncbi:TPA: hypothetical protein LA460_000119 [Clostridium botulinum]|nr:hypothetical protein [Clostridium botulinum]HBJ1652724.1 hypothetical protein [Clostridium botulinum]
MEYISVEEFLKQPKEVQNVFIGWWKPSQGDLYSDLHNNILVINVQLELFKSFANDIKEYATPLFTEGQLRKFIEDKTGGKVESYYAWDWYTIAIRDTGCGGDDPQIDTEETNLLQAYWKVACEIAKEE